MQVEEKVVGTILLVSSGGISGSAGENSNNGISNIITNNNNINVVSNINNAVVTTGCGGSNDGITSGGGGGRYTSLVARVEPTSAAEDLCVRSTTVNQHHPHHQQQHLQQHHHHHHHHLHNQQQQHEQGNNNSNSNSPKPIDMRNSNDIVQSHPLSLVSTDRHQHNNNSATTIIASSNNISHSSNNGVLIPSYTTIAPSTLLLPAPAASVHSMQPALPLPPPPPATHHAPKVVTFLHTPSEASNNKAIFSSQHNIQQRHHIQQQQQHNIHIPQQQQQQQVHIQPQSILSPESRTLSREGSVDVSLQSQQQQPLLITTQPPSNQLFTYVQKTTVAPSLTLHTQSPNLLLPSSTGSTPLGSGVTTTYHQGQHQPPLSTAYAPQHVGQLSGRAGISVVSAAVAVGAGRRSPLEAPSINVAYHTDQAGQVISVRHDHPQQQSIIPATALHQYTKEKVNSNVPLVHTQSQPVATLHPNTIARPIPIQPAAVHTNIHHHPLQKTPVRHQLQPQQHLVAVSRGMVIASNVVSSPGNVVDSRLSGVGGASVKRQYPGTDMFKNATEVTPSRSVTDGRDSIAGTPELWNNPQQTAIARTPLDLSDWKGHRVLAKKNNHYYPAVISSVRNLCELIVRLDHCPGKEITYTNMFNICKYDVVSDSVPGLQQLTEGVRVVARLDREQQVFVEAEIFERRSSLMGTHYLVRTPITSSVAPIEHLVMRPHLRLLQPPWWEDLESLSSSHIPSPLTPVTPRPLSSTSHHQPATLPIVHTSNGGSSDGGIMKSCVSRGNSGLPSTTVATSSSSTTAAAGQYPADQTVPVTVYSSNNNSYGGSPHAVGSTSLSHHSITPAEMALLSGSGGSDELRRRQAEEYDSDDDLGREDISFPSDSGLCAARVSLKLS